MSHLPLGHVALTQLFAGASTANGLTDKPVPPALRRHAEAVAARLDAARARTVQLAARHGARFAAPPAGLFGWLDAGVDTAALGQRMLDRGWLTAPGHLFYPERRTSTCVRVNFAAAQEAAFWQVLERER